MTAKPFDRQQRNRIAYFFPFQLVALHLKRNQFLLLLWLILFAFTTRSFADKFGIPYLFLAPEYLGQVGIYSYAILGFALGGFIMAFNIFSYITHSSRFPFLGTLSRPFFKFCINNFIIPLAFVITYIWCSSSFLYTVELRSVGEIIRYMLAFLLGNMLFIILAVIYFFPTNKNIFKISGVTEEELEALLEKKRSRLRREELKYLTRNGRRKWRVDTYLSHPFKISLARNTDHYDRSTLLKVFYQNHVNASLFEILIVLIFFFIGVFQYTDYFIIPAAASACLVLTFILMAISIAMSWLKSWTFSALIAFILLINFASSHQDILNMTNYAYGLDYEAEPVAYNMATLDSLSSNLSDAASDLAYHETILNAWLAEERIRHKDPDYKPKLIVVNVSGGGLRSSLWTMRSLQFCDSLFGGKLMRNTKLISGSSGGIIGASYYRELYLRRDSLSPGLYSRVYLDNISKDLLNRVLFSFATNDIFIRFRKREIAGREYILDRGMTFEDQLNKNTGYIFDKAISDYREPVSRGEIPMIIMAPTVVSDGRRMLISSQPLSFMTYEFPKPARRLNLGHENIEFAKMFARHDAENLRYTSALRMNATFPYILPNASLPTKPRVEVMDAGLRDNFGMKITVEYLHSLRLWIEKNTSGIIILQIRDTKKLNFPGKGSSTILSKMINPIGSFYGNYFNDQDYNMDQLLKMTDEEFIVPIYHIPLEIHYGKGERVALSWHLTALEKKRIISSIDAPRNRESIERLGRLLE